MTAWNPLIPNPNNVPANDAISMQQNFAVLNSAFSVDHVELQQSTGQGQHKKITFSQPPTALPLPVVAQQSYLYERPLVQQIPADPIRTFLEYQSAGPNPDNIIPLSFKAWGILQADGSPAALSIVASFNVRPAAAGVTFRVGQFWNIAFLSNMPTINFMVFTGYFHTPNNQTFSSSTSAKAVTGIQIRADANAAIGDQLFFVVL